MIIQQQALPDLFLYIKVVQSAFPKLKVAVYRRAII